MILYDPDDIRRGDRLVKRINKISPNPSKSFGIFRSIITESGNFYIYLLIMDEKSQVIYMQTRLTRLAAEQWKMSLPQVASLFEERGVYRYIAKMWDLFHIEGDLAVLDDVKQYLDAKEAACG